MSVRSCVRLSVRHTFIKSVTLFIKKRKKKVRHTFSKKSQWNDFFSSNYYIHGIESIILYDAGGERERYWEIYIYIILHKYPTSSIIDTTCPI